MRRWLAAVAVGAAVTLALAGCGAPAGVDRDLIDDWPAPVAAQQFVPAADVCHHSSQQVGFLTGYNPVACTEAHRVETVHVGTLTGPGAERGTPPPAGSAGMRTAQAGCETEVSKAVGADWRSGRLGLTVVLPSPPAWAGGARWYRCDVTELASIDDTAVDLRTGSLRGALTGAAPLAYRCFNPKLVKDDIDAMEPVSCTAKHHAEFVGIWRAPDISYAEFNRTTKRTHRACQTMTAKYVKVPDNAELDFRAGTIYYQPYEQEWKNGNRGVQCFLWVSDRNLTRSLKGAGTKGLPVT
ncbi:MULTISPECIES: septum formation family protein [unclassified Micromonospora]|uniref:septum formation family protein n=1 Tax=unclassified Micromonospora TaxID=2617518 RepID=UPI00339E05F5